MTPGLIRPIPKIKVPGSAAAFIAVLTSQVGYREGHNNDNAFGVFYGANHVAWCNEFQWWGAAHSRCSKIIPKSAYTPATAQWFKDRGQWHSTPKVGDLGFVYGNAGGGNYRIHHVFAVVAVVGDRVTTIEGNTNDTGSAVGNGVYSLKRKADLGAHGGYGRPKYAKLPATAIPTVSLAAAQAEAKAGTFTGPVAAALNAKGFPPTRDGYAALQRSEHYTGHDANGLPGITTFTRLGAETGLFKARTP